MKNALSNFALSLVGIAMVVAMWGFVSTFSKDLPSPIKTWTESKIYNTSPWENGERWIRAFYAWHPTASTGWPRDSC